MYSVIDNENTIIIKNSRFICILRHIDDVSNVNKYLNDAKLKYKDATHYCYAYIINNISKCSDDGESSGTAGMPMLQVLKMNNLNNVLCIVIRYFGKILLGASGLVRAYTKSVTECLANHIKEYTLGYNVTIMFDYDNLNTINYLLKSDSVISKKFEKRVSYNINIDNDTFNKLKQLNNCEIIINKDIYL